MTGTATAELCTAIEKWARDFEPRLLDGTGAQRALRKVARMKAMCAAVEAGLARRVAETNAWQRGGHKSPAHSVAASTGTSIGEARRRRAAAGPSGVSTLASTVVRSRQAS